MQSSQLSVSDVVTTVGPWLIYTSVSATQLTYGSTIRLTTPCVTNYPFFIVKISTTYERLFLDGVSSSTIFVVVFDQRIDGVTYKDLFIF